MDLKEWLTTFFGSFQVVFDYLGYYLPFSVVHVECFLVSYSAPHEPTYLEKFVLDILSFLLEIFKI